MPKHLKTLRTGKPDDPLKFPSIQKAFNHARKTRSIFWAEIDGVTECQRFAGNCYYAVSESWALAQPTILAAQEEFGRRSDNFEPIFLSGEAA